MSNEVISGELVLPPRTPNNSPEEKRGILRRHKKLTALGTGALIFAGSLFWASNQERYATDDCTDMTHAQLDVNSDIFSLANFSRTHLNATDQQVTLRDFASKVSEIRSYTISSQSVVDLNPSLAAHADKPFSTAVACVEIPAPQLKSKDGYIFVQRKLPANLLELVKGSDGTQDIKQVQAMAAVNSDAWLEVITSGKLPDPESNYFPPDTDFISRIAEQPGITDAAINKTITQAQELGLIG